MATLAFVLAHWSEILEALTALGMLASVVVGLLPRAARYAPVLGAAVRFLGWFSVLTHADAPGTLTLPRFVTAALEALRHARAGEEPPRHTVILPPAPKTPEDL